MTTTNKRGITPHFFLLIFILILMSCSVYAITNPYRYSGINQNSDYPLYLSSDYSSYTKGITNINKNVITEDFDNDGIIEIMVLDRLSNVAGSGWVIKVYDSRNLNLLASSNNLTLNNYLASNLISFDFDRDSFYEGVVLSRFPYTTHVINYNNGTITIETVQEINTINPTAQTVDMYIQCSEDDLICMSIIENVDPNHGLYLTMFNMSGHGTTLNFENDATLSYAYCLPHNPSIAVYDANKDGIDEFIFSYLEIGLGSSPEILHIVGFQPNMTTLTAIQTINIENNLGNINSVSDTVCLGTGGEGGTVTPVLMHNTDGSTSNGIEMLVATKIDANDKFQIFSYNTDTKTLVDDYPEFPSITPVYGEFLSNIFITDFIENTGNTDFCVIGFNKDTGQNNFLCGTERTSPEHLIGEIEIGFNITTSNDLIGTYAYGVLLNNTYPAVFTSAGMDVLGDSESSTFSNPIGQMEIYPTYSSGDGSGRFSMTGVTDTNIWVLSDNFINKDCLTYGCINTIYFNPSIDEPIRNNTNFGIRVMATDFDDDAIFIKATIYNNLPYNQSFNSTVYVSSGSTVSFQFTTPNVSLNSEILIEVWDEENPTMIEQETFLFSVTPDGNIYGETSKLIDFDDTGAIVGDGVSDDGDNVITDGVNKLSSTFNVGTTTIILILLGFIIWGIFTSDATTNLHTKEKTLISFLLTIIVLVIGGLSGLISFGIIIIFALILFLVVAVVVGRLLLSSSGD